jgi:hypothetical protein
MKSPLNYIHFSAVFSICLALSAWAQVPDRPPGSEAGPPPAAPVDLAVLMGGDLAGSAWARKPNC